MLSLMHARCTLTMHDASAVREPADVSASQRQPPAQPADATDQGGAMQSDWLIVLAPCQPHKKRNVKTIIMIK